MLQILTFEVELNPNWTLLNIYKLGLNQIYNFSFELEQNQTIQILYPIRTK